MHNLFFKTLYDRRWFALGWSIGFIAIAALMASFYPAMRMDGALDALVANMPKAFEGLVGDLANLRDFTSYIASQLFDIRLPLIAGIMAIILGQGLSTAEEERGELRTLLALPLSRTSILLQKWFAMVLLTGVVVASLGVGIYAVAPFLDDATLSVQTFLELASVTWLLVVTYGTIAFSMGVITGSKAVANAVSILVIMGSFILSTFGQAVDWLAPYEKLSLIHYFPAMDIAKQGLDVANTAILGAVTLGMLLLAILIFRRRDVK